MTHKQLIDTVMTEEEYNFFRANFPTSAYYSYFQCRKADGTKMVYIKDAKIDSKYIAAVEDAVMRANNALEEVGM